MKFHSTGQGNALNTRSLIETDPNCIVLPVVSCPMHHVVDTVYFIENNPIHFQWYQLSNDGLCYFDCQVFVDCSCGDFTCAGPTTHRQIQRHSLSTFGVNQW